MRRPFSNVHIGRDRARRAADAALELPLPRPLDPGHPPPSASSTQEVRRKYLSFDVRRLEEAKRLLEEAGVDPSVLDKLVERIKNIDKEIEELEEELSYTKHRISELEGEKSRIYTILSKFLEE